MALPEDAVLRALRFLAVQDLVRAGRCNRLLARLERVDELWCQAFAVAPAQPTIELDRGHRYTSYRYGSR